jgi:hypothetical protein
MAEQINSGSVLISYLKIKDLQSQLDTKENNEWMRLMHAPHFLNQELNSILKEREVSLSKKALRKLILDTEELLKIAAHHKFLNGNSIKVWSPLKSVHTALVEFEKSLMDLPKS